MKINGNDVLKQMALFICTYLQYWRWYRARCGPGSKRTGSGRFPNRVFYLLMSGLQIRIGPGKSFATRYCELVGDENSGSTGVRSATILRDGL